MALGAALLVPVAVEAGAVEAGAVEAVGAGADAAVGAGEGIPKVVAACTRAM